MARKSPSDTAKQREALKGAIRESNEDILRRLRRDALEGLKRLGAPQEKHPSTSDEIQPGINYEDVGIQLAKGKSRRRRRSTSYA